MRGLQPEKPLRSLRELFYNQISEASGDYPYIRTECVIDVVQATAYLMEVGGLSTGIRCPFPGCNSPKPW